MKISDLKRRIKSEFLIENLRKISLKMRLKDDEKVDIAERGRRDNRAFAPYFSK